MNKLFLTFCGISLALFASAQQVSTHVFKTINGQQLKLDVYTPSTNMKTGNPVIILFHGGGLVGGRKEQMQNQCLYFAEKGVVAVTADYRLLPKNTSEVQSLVLQCIRDAKTAVRWVKQHAGQFNIDTSRVFLGGGSAGGFLATEAALNKDINEATDNLNISTRAQALVLYNPAYIPEKRYAPPVVQYISKQVPPAVLFYGDKDKYKPGGDKFFNRLQQERVSSELWVAAGETHSFFNKSGWNDATNRKAYNFLVKNNLLKGVPEKDVAGFILKTQRPAAD